MAKVALRLRCAKQSKNLERYLIDTYASFLVSLMNFLIRYVQDIYDNALFALSNYVSNYSEIAVQDVKP